MFKLKTLFGSCGGLVFDLEAPNSLPLIGRTHLTASTPSSSASSDAIVVILIGHACFEMMLFFCYIHVHDFTVRSGHHCNLISFLCQIDSERFICKLLASDSDRLHVCGELLTTGEDPQSIAVPRQWINVRNCIVIYNACNNATIYLILCPVFQIIRRL